MFTGIIEELGTVVSWTDTADAARLTIAAPLATSDAARGDSISVNGVCLTVVDFDSTQFTVDVMAETIAASTLSSLTQGAQVNIERAARVGDRIGGHIVQGHVDGMCEVLSVTEGEAWRVLRFAIAAELARLVANKGSVALNGVSLTVSAVSAPLTDNQWFEVSLIPETLSVTTLGALALGDRVNVETDILARQVERMLEFERRSSQ